MKLSEYLLACMAEEAAEIAQDCMKALRFGPDDIGPKGKPNMELIANELDDLCGVANMLRRAKTLRQIDKGRVNAKIERVKTWMGYSQQVGALEARKTEHVEKEGTEKGALDGTPVVREPITEEQIRLILWHLETLHYEADALEVAIEEEEKRLSGVRQKARKLSFHLHSVLGLARSVKRHGANEGLQHCKGFGKDPAGNIVAVGAGPKGNHDPSPARTSGEPVPGSTLLASGQLGGAPMDRPEPDGGAAAASTLPGGILEQCRNIKDVQGYLERHLKLQGKCSLHFLAYPTLIELATRCGFSDESMQEFAELIVEGTILGWNVLGNGIAFGNANERTGLVRAKGTQ